MTALVRFGPPVALMGLIYFLSAQPVLGPDLGLLDLLLRKLAHVALYAGLFLLWRRALPERPAWIAAAIAVGYGCTDEWHQSFVEGRRGTPVDVLIDAIGIGLAHLGAHLLAVRRRG